MRLVFISDTHQRHDFVIPDGDVLIHAGDFTMEGRIPELQRFASWINVVRIGGGFKDVVVIPGNHELGMPKNESLFREMLGPKVTFLVHQPAVVGGLRFFGSPYTPRFFDWEYNVDRGELLARLWSQIPSDTQVLVTHGPPYGRLDSVNRPGGEMDAMDFGSYGKGDRSRRHRQTHVGCVDLMQRIQDLKDLRLHVFGHIHAPGVEAAASGVMYVNASTCNQQYKAVHKPHIFDWNDGVMAQVN